MEKASGSGVKPATRFGFDFSWADEVEREEREQQEQLAMVQQPVPEAEKEQKTTRTDPFGAARPREVVLAEKGVDWRARDREIDAAAARHVAVSAAREPAASIRGRTVPPPTCAPRSTPARCAPRERGSVRTPAPRRRDAESTPQAKDVPPANRSAWGGGKRRCVGKVPAPATARRARAVKDQGRRVFGELNVGEGCASPFRTAAKKSFNSRGIEKDGTNANEAAVVGGGVRNRDRGPIYRWSEEEGEEEGKKGRIKEDREPATSADLGTNTRLN